METQKQEKKKQLIQHFVTMIILLLMFVILLVIYFHSALGWFVTSKNVEGDGMLLQAFRLDARAAYFVYTYDIKNNTVHYTGEGAPGGDPAIDNLDVAFYDTIFTIRNRYTPAVIRVECTDLKYTAGTVQVTIDRNTVYPNMEEETVANQIKLNPSKYFSGAMRFTIAKSPGWYGDQPSAAVLYSRVDGALYPVIVTDEDYLPGQVPASATNPIAYAKGNSEVFVTDVERDQEGDLVDITKTDSIVLSVDYTEADLNDTDGDSVGDTLNIYLYITYDEELVKEYQASGISSNSTAVGQVLDLENDIKKMTISFSEN